MPYYKTDDWQEGNLRYATRNTGTGALARSPLHLMCVSVVVENIRSLMKTMKLTAKQAMDALMIPAADQQKYAAQV